MIHIHLLPDLRLAVIELMHGNILADLGLGDDLLLQHGGRPGLEAVALLLLLALVGRDVIAHQGSLLGRDDAHVDVAAAAEVVENTRLDGVARELDRRLARQGRLPLRLEDRHGRQRAAAHRDVGELVGRAVRVHCEEPDARGVDARDDEIRADVALVAEEMLLQERHAGDDARLAAGGEGVQL